MRQIFFLALLLFLTGTAHAIDLAAFGSYWGVKDGDDSWGAGVKAGLPLFTDYLQLEGRGYWYPDSHDDLLGDVGLIPVDFGAAVHLAPHSSFDIYLAGGASYIFADSTHFSLEDTFGAYVGPGVEYRLNSFFAVTGEALVRFADLDFGEDWRDKTYDATGLTINLGLRLRIL